MNGDAIAIMAAIGNMKAELKEDLGSIKESVALNMGKIQTDHATLRGDFEGFVRAQEAELANIKKKQNTDDWRHWVTAVAIPSFGYALYKVLQFIGWKP